MLPLANKWIVITRPEHQAGELQNRLEEAGAQVILFPLLGIEAADNCDHVMQALSRISSYDLAIFVSPNAVEYTFKIVDSSCFEGVKVAAIGKKTAAMLKSKGIHVDYFPDAVFNSESLLKMPEIMAYKEGKKVVILRGNGGREYLKESLENQGADVTYIDVYQRVFPQDNLDRLDMHYQHHELDLILLSSGESLDNLFKFEDAYPWLDKVDLMVGSNRIKQQALQIKNYHGNLIATEDPSDDTFFETLLDWAREEQSEH